MTSQPRLDLASFWKRLPTEGRWLLSTVAIQTLGRGLTLPFTVIYLHEVRHIPLATASSLMSIIGIAALVGVPLVGKLVDRLGARTMVIVATLLQMAGSALLAFTTTVPVAAAAMIMLGVAAGISWPSFNALVAALVTGPTRQQYFGINFALVNLGIGVGGLLAGSVVDVDRPMTFVTIYLVDAASMLVPLALMLGPLRHVHGRVAAPEDPSEHPPSYRSILHRPAMRCLLGITALASFVGYGQMEAGFPAFARQYSQVSTGAIGIAFAVNTAVIVGLQFAVLRLIQGHRRTSVLAVLALSWAAAWSLLSLTQLVAGSSTAAMGVVLFHVVFAFGETMLQPTIPAITNDLAPDHLRGRYNALSSGAYQLGAVAGPIAAGWLLQHRMSGAYLSMLVVGCLLIVGLGRVLERLLTPVENGLTTD